MMTRDEYNAKVQELQYMWGDMSRVRPSYGVSDKLQAAYFEVYWDGQWHQLGVQRYPFTDRVSYEWNDGEDINMRAKFADALVRS